MARSETQCRFEASPIEAALARLERLGGDDLVDRMIEAFLQNVTRTVAETRAAFEGHDAERMERAAHSLKSSAANVGADGLRYLARSIEEIAAEKGTFSEAAGRLEPLVEELPAAFGEVRRFLTARGSNR